METATLAKQNTCKYIGMPEKEKHPQMNFANHKDRKESRKITLQNFSKQVTKLTVWMILFLTSFVTTPKHPRNHQL